MVESLLACENRFPRPTAGWSAETAFAIIKSPGWVAETAVGKEGSRGKITAILSDFQYSLPVLRFFGMFFAFLSS